MDMVVVLAALISGLGMAAIAQLAVGLLNLKSEKIVLIAFAITILATAPFYAHVFGV